MWKRLLGGGAAFGFLGTGYAYYVAKEQMGEDAIERIIIYDKVAIPAVLEYKWLEARCDRFPKFMPFIFPPLSEEEETCRFEALHHKYAKPLYDVFMKLGGFYYKSGQKIASNMAGVIPQIYIDMFQPFLNDIPARDPEDVRKVVEGELGCSREEIFSYWEEKPIGCASIGQVHRATLKSTGERVVVKVQNPEAERTFKGDVFALKVLVDTFMPQLSVAFDEIQKQFATEFDYRGEMNNSLEIRRNLKNAGFDDVIIPKVYQEYCSKKVLVMEEIYPSIPLHDALDKQAETMAREKGMTKKEFLEKEKERIEEETRELAKDGKVKESISASDYDKYIALQKTKRGSLYALKQVYNWTLGWFFTNYDTSQEDVFIPLNAARLIDDLLKVHGHEVLIDGCFNADPHPGNILCVDRKLALIDYGQVKRISEQNRIDLAKSILLINEAIKVDPRSNPDIDMRIHERAKQSVTRHSRKIGMKTKKDLDDTYYELMTVYLGRMDAAWIYPRNVIQWTDWMEERDPMGSIDEVDYLVMVNMSSMMLRGLGMMLQQNHNLAEDWAPFARRVLHEKGLLEDVEAEIAAWSQ